MFKNEEGQRIGERQKALEAALVLIKDFNATPELAAEKMGASLEDVLKALEAENSTD